MHAPATPPYLRKPLLSDLGKYWRSVGLFVGGILVIASLPWLVKMNGNPGGVQLVAFMMAAVISLVAWIKRPKRMEILSEDGLIKLKAEDGMVLSTFQPNAIASIDFEIVGDVLKYELFRLAINETGKAKKVGPFLLPDESRQEIQRDLECLLRSAQAAQARARRDQKGRSETVRSSLIVDLGTFSVGSTSLGSRPSPADPFYSALTQEEVFEPQGKGVELSSKDGILDCGFFTLAAFEGTFTRHGQPVELDAATSEAEVCEIFGEPYWIDRSGDEVLLFYEYEEGTIELQFEFPDSTHLGVITLCQNGVLSDSENRRMYGVTKLWPPHEEAMVNENTQGTGDDRTLRVRASRQMADARENVRTFERLSEERKNKAEKLVERVFFAAFGICVLAFAIGFSTNRGPLTLKVFVTSFWIVVATDCFATFYAGRIDLKGISRITREKSPLLFYALAMLKLIFALGFVSIFLWTAYKST